MLHVYYIDKMFLSTLYCTTVSILDAIPPPLGSYLLPVTNNTSFISHAHTISLLMVVEYFSPI